MTLRVLVVESDAEEILFLRDVLTELDGSPEWSEWTHLEALFTSSWAEASALLTTERVDVILLNLDLSDSRGRNTFLRFQVLAPQIPIVLLVPQTSGPSLAEHLLREGAQDFLSRNDVDCAPLAHAMRNAIDRHRLLAAARATSMIDSLTGLLSRDAFLLLAERDRTLATRMHRRQVMILAEPQPASFMANTSANAAAANNMDEQRRDLELVAAADHLRNLAGVSDLVARVGLVHLAISILDSEEESAEEIWVRVHLAADARRIKLGVAVFDPDRPVDLEQLLDRAAKDLYPSSTVASRAS
ncbi:MAG: hypothetical protein ABI811_14115 [Acidobacteriota bacterium]